MLRGHERVLALLREGGLDDERAAAVLRAYTAWLLGCAAVELRPTVDNPEEPDPSFRLGLHRIPAQEPPTLREFAPALAVRGGPAGLAAGPDALLDRFGETGGGGAGASSWHSRTRSRSRLSAPRPAVSAAPP